MSISQIAALEFWIDSLPFYVYDPALDFGVLNHGAPQILTQGFSGHPRSYKFFTLGECFRLRVEIWIADTTYPEEIVLRDDTIRAVMLPFSTTGRGVKISPIGGIVELLCGLSVAMEYALVFEIKLRDDAEYLSSSRYQENLDAGFTEECCYLTFYPRKESVLPQILRADTFDTPPTFNRYTPVVATTETLILDDEPTEELRW